MAPRAHPLQAGPSALQPAPSRALQLVEQAYAAAARGDADVERVAWSLVVGELPERLRGPVRARIARLSSPALGASLDAADEVELARCRPSHWPLVILSLATAALSAWLYALVYGAAFAGGFVVGMYLHELGHALALRRLRLPFSPPIFVPFVGAMVRMDRRPERLREYATIALAGPGWGLGFCALCLLGWHAGGSPILATLGLVLAWVNLFNLLPLGPLDGARAFLSLTTRQRVAASAALLALALVTLQITPAVLAIGAALSARRAAPPSGDRATLVRYLAIATALACLTM